MGFSVSDDEDRVKEEFQVDVPTRHFGHFGKV